MRVSGDAVRRAETQAPTNCLLRPHEDTHLTRKFSPLTITMNHPAPLNPNTNNEEKRRHESEPSVIKNGDHPEQRAQRADLSGDPPDDGTPDELVDYDDQLSTSTDPREDQISLSSSSTSWESIPEIRQRQNLQKLYHIVNEICSSEAKFVQTLRLLNVDFREHVLGAAASQSQPAAGSAILSHTGSQGGLDKPVNLGQPPYDCISAMLRHLPQLQSLNESLLGELEQARDQWPKTQKISHVLVKIGPFLKHYSSYIREFESNQQQFLDNLKKFPQFCEKVKQFESNDKCQKLSVQHHLLKPIQRIPQYRLLLQQYLHHLKPDDMDYEDTVNALEVVSRVAEHANQSMNEGANFAKLLALQAKIVCKQRDIIQPGRLFIKEGELMKICRKQNQPRWFVLLSDALLYLTQIQSSDILYLNYELPLDDCQVLTPNDNSKLADHQQQTNGQQLDTEFSVSTPIRSFSLIAKSRQERDEWVGSLRRTIEEHVARRRSFSVRSAPAGDENGGQSNQLIEAFGQLLGRKAPIWTPDSRATMCQLCTSNFSALFRRHHCRACGRVVCSACSSNKAPLIYLKCRPARVCDQCFASLKANIHLYYLPASRGLMSQGQPTDKLDERELRRLDEYFRTLLKSQFVRHVGIDRLKRSLMTGLNVMSN